MMKIMLILKPHDVNHAVALYNEDYIAYIYNR